MFYFMKAVDENIQTNEPGKGLPMIRREFFSPGLYSSTDSSKNEGTIRVVQWNILADALAESTPTTNFVKTEPEFLQWSYRKKSIMGHLQQLDADIICLEEVDHFYDEIQPFFESMDYTGIFHPKLESPCLRNPKNNGPDGVAIFYKKQRFSCKQQSCYHLSKLDGSIGNQPLIIVELIDNEKSLSFLVGVTHFKAKQGFEDLRYYQAKQTICYLDNMKKICNRGDVSVILCGDFNGENSEEFYNHLINNESIPLRDAYSSAFGLEMPFTTWKFRPGVEVKHAIDYIWFSPVGLALSKLLLPPKECDIGPDRFPAFNHPSDHILLCCDFVVR